MIIVSQDKKLIVNFDNVSYIYISDDDSCEYHIMVQAPAPMDGSVGCYGTEERAKEVLEKMINAIGLGMYKYDMPQK